ncbi:MAG: hypothetical protein WEB63_04210 [Cucumibacter sp.]
MIEKTISRLIAAAAVAFGAASLAVAQDNDYDEAFAARLANPDDIAILGQFLTAAVEKGEYDQAISTVEQHLINHPRDAKARLIAARLYFQVGSWELSRRQLLLALEIGTLSPEDLEDAEDLLATVEDRIEGFSAMFFLTGGVRVEHTDYNQADGAPLADRTDINPFATVGGRVFVDLKTATNDAVILEGSLGAARRFGDFDFDGTGEIYTGWMGNFAFTLSKGMPGIFPTLRGDYSFYGRFETFDAGLIRNELGVSKRLAVRPTARSLLFTEAGLGWLGASSTDLPGEWRRRVEAGTAIRTDIGTFGLAARGFRDFDAAFAAIGQTGEIEASFSSQLGAIPDTLVWSHRLSGALGMLSVPDVNNPGLTFDGTYWRVGWDHVIQFDGGNRANLGISYRNTEYPSDPDRDTASLAASFGFTLVLD